MSGDTHNTHTKKRQVVHLYHVGLDSLNLGFTDIQLTDHNTGVIPLFSRSACAGSFKPPPPPPIERREMSTDGVAKEGRPEFNPRPGQGLNPEPPGGLSEILPTALTSHTYKFKLVYLGGICFLSMD